MEKPFVFCFDGIIICTLSLIGASSNIFAITVLWTRDKMISFFHKLLISLFCIDSVVLLTSILWNLRWSLGLKVSWLTVLYPYVILPFNHIAMTSSIFMTIGIAYERYKSRRNPIEQEHNLQNSTSQIKRLLLYIIPILAFSTIFNIPKFLELKLIYAPSEVHKYIQNIQGQASITTNFVENLQHSSDMIPTWKDAILVPEIYISDFLIANQHYLVYYYWTCVFILGVLPFTFLIFLNFHICKSIREQNYEVTNTIDEEASISNHNRRIDEERSITKVAIVIIVVFLICHGLRTFVQLFLGACELDLQCGGVEWHPIILSLSNFFIILNSSINIVIYCIVCKKFRKDCSKTSKEWVNAIALKQIWRTDLQASNNIII